MMNGVSWTSVGYASARARSCEDTLSDPSRGLYTTRKVAGREDASGYGCESYTASVKGQAAASALTVGAGHYGWVVAPGLQQ